jgi:hypothetical protein
VDTVPLPSFKPPLQWALPVRCISSSCLVIEYCWTQITRWPEFLPAAEEKELPHRQKLSDSQSGLQAIVASPVVQ